MKKIHLVLIIALVVIADQALKIYVKTSFPLNTSHPVAGSWFQLYFVENPGMAYGWKFGGNWGKLALTVFRMGAVIFGTWYLGKIIKQKYSTGFIICAALIYAGALGNLIDSCFYGLIFDKGMLYDPQLNEYIGYDGLSILSKHGYASFLHGNVVDMLYFPVLHGHFPSWLPVWGGEDFEFFRPIFNIADAAISTGVITILVFQKSFFKNRHNSNDKQAVETTALVNDTTQVS
ncbi:MAG: lipoprotein signal peptidase [Bacteroidetes bacterium]|nr:lipoprotein signal peptidase [Bacteroidota bacterium]MBS1758245.1 lipoprotein signal peptidase [Bacteroidota bacterium]